MEDNCQNVNDPKTLAGACPFTAFTRAIMTQPNALCAIKHIQASEHLNVNIVLFILWFSQSGGGRLSTHDLAILEKTTSTWHQRVTMELKLTNALLENNQSLIASELQTELQDEIAKAQLIEQQMLYDVCHRFRKFSPKRSPTRCLRDAILTLGLYTANQSSCEENTLTNSLAQLLSATFNRQIDSDVVTSVSLKAFKNEVSDKQLTMQLSD